MDNGLSSQGTSPTVSLSGLRDLLAVLERELDAYRPFKHRLIAGHGRSFCGCVVRICTSFRLRSGDTLTASSHRVKSPVLHSDFPSRTLFGCTRCPFNRTLLPRLVTPDSEPLAIRGVAVHLPRICGRQTLGIYPSWAPSN